MKSFSAQSILTCAALVSLGPLHPASGRLQDEPAHEMSTSSTAAPDDVYWTSPIVGLSGRVFDFDLYQGELIACGEFQSNVNSTVFLGGVGKWNGSTWASLSTPALAYDSLPSSVAGQALVVYDSLLIVGGRFNKARTVAANHIAAWNGSAWSALGTGMGPWNGYVTSLAVYGGKLIAAGSFASAGGAAVANIAQWDGVGWTALGAGLNGVVWELAVFDGKLIATGGFSMAGGGAASRIASWDGAGWTALGSGLTGGDGHS